NVLGTRRVLSTFSGCRFVHISTASVYDPLLPKRCASESAPLAHTFLNNYVWSKRLAEQEVLRSRRDAVILRPHAVYGPGDTTLLPHILRARRAGCLIAVGNGRNRISLTHVDNLVCAVVQSLTSPVDGPLVCNVADADPETLDRLLRAFLRAF